MHLLEGGGTRDDLQQLLGHGRLARAVVLLAEGLGQGRRVITRALHALHPSSQLRRNGFLKGSEDLTVEVERKDGVDDLERVLLEDHVVGELLRLGHVELLALDSEVATRGGQLEDLVALVGDLAGRERNEGAHAGRRGDERDELRVKELDRVRLPGQEGVDDLLADAERLLGVGVLSAVVLCPDGEPPSLEVGAHLLADEDHVGLDALGLELVEPGLGLLDHEGVVTAAQAAVAGDDDEGDLVDLPLGEEGKVDGLPAEALDEPPEDALEGLGERPGGEDGVLRPPHLRGGHELHGARDLLRVVHGRDAIADGVRLAVHDDRRPAGAVGGRREDVRGGGGEHRLVGRRRREGGGGGDEGRGDAKELHGQIGY